MGREFLSALRQTDRRTTATIAGVGLGLWACIWVLWLGGLWVVVFLGMSILGYLVLFPPVIRIERWLGWDGSLTWWTVVLVAHLSLSLAFFWLSELAFHHWALVISGLHLLMFLGFQVVALAVRWDG